jgi:DNA-binding transcriptional LysR family regulator
MQFESLKVFCDVARRRSFSQAAGTNRISQSAVSQIVLQLEKRLGVQLVDRSRRPLKLTREGQVYYDGCKKLMEQYLGVEAAVRNLNARITSSVRVAAIYSVGLRDMSQYVQRFMAAHPGVDTDIEYLHPDRVYEKVQEGAVDFGLVSFPRPTRKLIALPWREEEMVVACAPGHPFAGLRSVKVSALAGQKYVAFAKGLVIRKKVDRFLREHDVAVETILEFDNIENIKDAIEISAGIALLPLPALTREVQAGALSAVPLTGGHLVRPLGVIHRRNPKPNATAMAFIALLRQPDEPALENAPVQGVYASGSKASGNGRGAPGEA